MRWLNQAGDRMAQRFPVLVLIASVYLLQGCMLHRSSSSIRGALLKQTPPGTHYDVVEAFVKSKGWHWKPSSWSGQYRSLKSNGLEAAVGGSTNVVAKAMAAYLGDYGVLPVSQCQVCGFWLFDGNNELTDIYISKRLISF